MNDLVYMPISKMRSHPHNMRRFYDAAGIRDLADSIKAQGILQPLVVTPNPEEPSPDPRSEGLGTRTEDRGGTFWVIIGNRRYHAGLLLGDECPLYPVRIIQDAAEVDQLLMMATENLQREDIDPISQAMHFQRLMEREGLSMSAIARQTGICQTRVSDALQTLNLPEPIQKLIGEGRLPRDRRVTRALLSIPDDEMRLRLANTFADDGATIKGIVSVCERVLEKMGRTIERRPATASIAKTGVAMIDHAQASGKTLPALGKAKWDDVRESAREMCNTCDAYTAKLRQQQPEPAWAMLAAAAGETCKACGLHEFEKVCASCPGVAFLKAMTWRESVR